MSSVTVNPRVFELHRAVRVTPAALEDATVVTDSIYRAHEKDLFNSEGASGGTAWKALSPDYKARKDRLFANATGIIKGIAAARGRKLSGAAVRAARGSDNKTLQLTGDMKAAFSTEAASIPDAGNSGFNAAHVSESFILPTGAQIRLGAQGPLYFDRPPGEGRDPQQRTEDQKAELVEGVRRAFIPHVVAALRSALRATVSLGGGSGA